MLGWTDGRLLAAVWLVGNGRIRGPPPASTLPHGLGRQTPARRDAREVRTKLKGISQGPERKVAQRKGKHLARSRQSLCARDKPQAALGNEARGHKTMVMSAAVVRT